MAIPAAALLIPAAIKAGTGIWQLTKGAKFAKEERPEFNIPQSAKDALEIAKSTATQRELPGQDIMEANMRSATAGGISRMTEVADSPAMLLGNISKMVSGENQQRNQLGVNAANYYQQNQRSLQSALNQFGQYELQKWQYDEAKPYDEAMRAAAMMREGGLQNISGAVGSAIGGLVGYEQNKEWMDIMRKMYTGTGNTQTLGVETAQVAADLLNGSTAAEMPLSPAEIQKIMKGDYSAVLGLNKKEQFTSNPFLDKNIKAMLGIE